MTIAAERAIQPLPSEVGGLVRGFLSQDKRFAKRRMGAGS